MCQTAPLAISGWQTIIVTVLAVLATIVYGEIRVRDALRRHRQSSAPHRHRSTIRDEDTVVRDH